MTLLVSWLGNDTHGPTSAYIVADSRIMWKRPSGEYFDFARKVFAFKKFPDIMGYCGDVLFPSMLLGQIVSLADSGLFFRENDSIKSRIEKVFEKIKNVRKNYPKQDSVTTSFSVIYIARDVKNNYNFEPYLISESSIGKLSLKPLPIPTISEVIWCGGIGKKFFDLNMEKYKKIDTHGTSRLVFHCFCRTLYLSGAQTIGGAPQLVGLWRKYNGLDFGIVRNNQHFFLGTSVKKKNIGIKSDIYWFNQLFERCSGITGERFCSAQRQPDILGTDY